MQSNQKPITLWGNSLLWSTVYSCMLSSSKDTEVLQWPGSEPRPFCLSCCLHAQWCSRDMPHACVLGVRQNGKECAGGGRRGKGRVGSHLIRSKGIMVLRGIPPHPPPSAPPPQASFRPLNLRRKHLLLQPVGLKTGKQLEILKAGRIYAAC